MELSFSLVTGGRHSLILRVDFPFLIKLRFRALRLDVEPRLDVQMQIGKYQNEFLAKKKKKKKKRSMSVVEGMFKCPLKAACYTL